ncbi:MAG: glutamate--cysteine ligase [Myxococcaceae bacterium]|nr:glutamate--cysteine ligase [Myxococcaceae bacterium]
MGLQIDRDEFTADDYAQFSERLAESIAVLRRAVERPGFGQGPATFGAELELYLVDQFGHPMPINLEVQQRCGDPRLTLELNRFNLELNLTPHPLAGRPFATLGAELEEALAKVEKCAAGAGARIATIGILPTLRQEDLGPNALTPVPRYRALSNGIRRIRNGEPLHIAVAGEESLQLVWDDVTPEGANTSLQFHLRIPPDEFADAWNAAQIATGPALALGANSPFFLGRKLWDETRVALFRQATDDRGELPADWRPPARVTFGRGWLRKGAPELFAEAVALHAPLIPIVSARAPRAELAAGGVPHLDELRLHNGTVWYWNRAVYDPTAEGHLRIEFRALPAGPSVVDMLANGAFLIGLTLGIQPNVERFLPGMPFVFARENFHRAAKDGVDAELLWPTDLAPSPRPTKVTDLLPDLLDLAARGLKAAGVEPEDFAPLLDIIRARAATRTTGARWQRRALANFEAHMPRGEAFARVLDRYLALSEEGRPVHEWEAG